MNLVRRRMKEHLTVFNKHSLASVVWIDLTGVKKGEGVKLWRGHVIESSGLIVWIRFPLWV